MEEQMSEWCRWSTSLLNPKINDALDYDWVRRLDNNLEFLKEYLNWFPRMAYVGSSTSPMELADGWTGSLEFGLALEFDREEVRRLGSFATFHVYVCAQSWSWIEKATFYAYFEGTPMGSKVADFSTLTHELEELDFHIGINYDGIEDGTKRWILRKGGSSSQEAKLFWVLAFWGATGDFSTNPP